MCELLHGKVTDHVASKIDPIVFSTQANCMKTNNISASRPWGRLFASSVALLMALVLSHVGSAVEPVPRAGAIHREDGPSEPPASIVRPRKVQRVADPAVTRDQNESEAIPAAALKPTLTDELVRPSQFVTGDSETTRETPAKIESQSKVIEAAESESPSGHSPLKLAKKKERSSAESKKARTSPEQSLRTIGGSLAVVIALVLGMALLFRQTQPKGAAALPLEVIEVLGRSTLTKGQNLQLVRIGGKLVLLCVTAHGSETLTEINDADEVERLSTLCRQSGPKSVSAAFRDVLAQIGSDTATGFVGSPAEAAGQPDRPSSWWQQQYS